jgi:hypothetical protein
MGFGTEITESKTIEINGSDSCAYDQVKRIWAEMKIAELDLQYEKNKDAITRLGKEFSIVTQNTSLIVLDRVEDYVEHEIVPPPDLQPKYMTLLNEKKAEDKNMNETAFQEALDAMNELKDWWNTDYRQGRKQVASQNSLRRE